MEIIAVVNRKGGVGKTATALALGEGLRRKNKSVLYIDLDSQTNLTSGLNASVKKLNSFDVLTGETTAAEAIQHTQKGDIIAGAEYLAKADIIIDGPGKEYRLKEAISDLDYDYIVIDTPAALGTLTVNALTAANSAIIPVQPDIDSLDGIGKIDNTIEKVRKYCNKDLDIKGILITRYDNRTVISRHMWQNLEKTAQKLNTWVYSKPIRECVSVKEAKASQTDIYSYAPRSNAVSDYSNFIDEFLDH